MSAIPIEDVTFVKELYPRLREDDAAIERYRAAIDRLPPIVIARGRILVDGFHRWQAHRREGLAEIEAEDLGDLSDVEILKESIRRNASHGRQLDTKDKSRMADLLYRQGTRDLTEVADLLSITKATAEKYVADARRDEKAEQKARAWDLWLDCVPSPDTWTELGELVGQTDKTAKAWVSEFLNEFGNSEAPESRQHFDVWSFGSAPDDVGTQSYFGRMPAQIVENLLWLYTEPGQTVFDPFAGGGTTIDVAKAMGRRVWSSDRKPSTPTLPIHEWDITTGWPTDAPNKVDFTLLDPPYWQQAKGRYSEDGDDLGNMTLDEFMAAWETVVKTVAEHTTGHIAYIISPTQTDDGVVDHAFEMYRACVDLGLKPERRIIVTYNTQQATGQQVTWARDNRRLLKLYRDLVVFRP